MMAQEGIAGGGNPSGFNTGGGIDAIRGGPHTSLMPAPFPSGQNVPSIFSNSARMKDTGGPQSTAGISGSGHFNPSQYLFPTNTPNQPTNLGGIGATGGNAGDPNGFSAQPLNSITQGFKNAGFSKGLAGLLTAFLQNGAGFNPQIAQALINAMQPQVDRGLAQIQEQFGVEGLGMSSPAAIGMGDFLSQVNLNEEQIFAQMQEQATQNYMEVLLAGKQQPKQPSGIGALLGGAGQLASAIPGLAGMAGIGGGAAASAAAGGGGAGADALMIALGLI